MTMLIIQKPERPRLETPMKPLFIPLKSEYFYAFKDGSKTKERRLAGKRWNFKTCPVGRDVILSKGYGKKERLSGYIVGTLSAQSSGVHFTDKDRQSIAACYGEGSHQIFEIEIVVEGATS